MRGRAPTLLILLLIAGLAVGIAAVLFVGQQQVVARLQQQLTTSQQQAAQLQTKNQELALELTGLQGERKTLEQRMASLRTELTASLAELDRSRAVAREMEDRVRTIDDERAKLQERLVAAIAERDEAQGQADRLTQERAALEQAAGRLRERMALLDRDYRRLTERIAESATATSNPGVHVIGQYDPTSPAAFAPQPPVAHGPPPASFPSAMGSVELPPIVVRKGQGGASTAVRGRLLEVNDTHGFVVLDQGSLEGVRTGMGFTVLRGGQRVGRVTAVGVRPHLSACDIVRAETPGFLQVGDHVVQGGP